MKRRSPFCRLSSPRRGLPGNQASGVWSSRKPSCRFWAFSETGLPAFGVLGNCRVIRFSEIYVLCRGPISGLRPSSTKRLRKTSTFWLMPLPCVPGIVPTTPYTGLALLSSLSHPPLHRASPALFLLPMAPVLMVERVGVLDGAMRLVTPESCELPIETV